MSVTLTELKNHLRIDDTDEDDSLSIYLSSAIEYVGSQCGRKLEREARTTYFDSFSSVMELVGDNPSSVVVTYIDTNGDEQTLSSSVYALKTHKALPYITLGYGQSWPSVRDIDAAISVTYTSGYDSSTLPDRLKCAILLEAATNYEYRENETMANSHNRKAVERNIRPLVIYNS